jgi:hypothetical protein
MVVNEDGSQEHLNISEWGSLGNVVKYEINEHIIYVTFQRRMENGIHIDYLFIYGDDIRDLTFKSILSMVYKASGASNRDTIKNVVGQLQSKLKSADSSKNPQAISLLSTLNIQRSNSPSLSSTEVEYYKSKQPGGYIFRYVGKIKPTFISNSDRWFNYRYGQKTFTDITWKEYSRYYSTGFLPTFPSIGYTNYVREVEDYDWYDKKEIK